MNSITDRRIIVARVGYVIVGCSTLLADILWKWTCALGGFHCFYGASGHAVATAQFGALLGLICSIFGRGPNRLVFSAIALIELASCYFQLLVH
jgi:hypothetical protein